MLLATCVNTPIDHSVFHDLRACVAKGALRPVWTGPCVEYQSLVSFVEPRDTNHVSRKSNVILLCLHQSTYQSCKTKGQKQQGRVFIILLPSGNVRIPFLCCVLADETQKVAMGFRRCVGLWLLLELGFLGVGTLQKEHVFVSRYGCQKLILSFSNSYIYMSLDFSKDKSVSDKSASGCGMMSGTMRNCESPQAHSPKGNHTLVCLQVSSVTCNAFAESQILFFIKIWHHSRSGKTEDERKPVDKTCWRRVTVDVYTIYVSLSRVLLSWWCGERNEAVNLCEFASDVNCRVPHHRSVKAFVWPSQKGVSTSETDWVDKLLYNGNAFGQFGTNANSSLVWMGLNSVCTLHPSVIIWETLTLIQADISWVDSCPRFPTVLKTVYSYCLSIAR